MTAPESKVAAPVGGVLAVPKLSAEWTHDCSGKQDYDADLVQLSTRYWPRGGGFMTYDAGTRNFTNNEDRPEIKPSAHAAILLQGDEIVSAEFEADTEGEVKAQVERWAAEQWGRIYSALALYHGRTES